MKYNYPDVTVKDVTFKQSVQDSFFFFLFLSDEPSITVMDRFHIAKVLWDSIVSSLGDMWIRSHLQSVCTGVWTSSRACKATHQELQFYTTQINFMLIASHAFIMVDAAITFDRCLFFTSITTQLRSPRLHRGTTVLMVC